MRNTNLLFKIIMISVIVLVFACQKDNTSAEDLVQDGHIIHQMQIPYSSVKSAHKQFIKQLNSETTGNNGFYSKESPSSIVVDTSNVTHITYGDYVSYTLPVVSEDTSTVLKNVLISENPDGTDSYMLLSYELDTTLDQINMSNVDGHILGRTATELTDTDIAFRAKNNSNCWSVETYTVNYCEDANGNTIRDNGQLGSGCVRNWHTETFTVLTIDLGCSGGGGNYDPNRPPTGSDPSAPGENDHGLGGILDGGGISKPTTPCKASTGLSGSDGCGTSLDTIAKDNLYQVLLPYLNQQQANWIYAADIDVVTALNDFIESSSVYNQNENQEGVIIIINYLITNQSLSEANNNAIDLINFLINNPETSFEEATTLYVDDTDPPEITDIDNELECFDLTMSAKLTIYAKQAIEGSREVTANTGHAFIGIEQGNVKRSIGFYPEHAAISVLVNQNSKLKDNSTSPYHVSVTVDISSQQLEDVINYIKNRPEKYDLNDYNCADFSLGVAQEGGLSIPDTDGSYGIFFEGTNPSDLGEDIRELPLPLGATSDTDGGNAPNRSPDC